MFVFRVKTDGYDGYNKNYIFIRKSNTEMASIFENPTATLIKRDEMVNLLLNNNEMTKIQLCDIHKQ